MALPRFFLDGLERALDIALGDSARARKLAAELAGKSAGITLNELGLTFYLLPGEHGVRVTDALDKPPDVMIRGTLPALLRASLQHDELPGGVDIAGDAALAQRFQKLLREAEFDWEEQFARAVGDVPAHQISKLLRGLAGWGMQAVAALGDSVAEYLQEESEDLPRRYEVERFLNDVDTLRMAVDRLEARLARLRKHMEPRA